MGIRLDEAEEYDEEELIEKLRDSYGFLGVVDETYYLFNGKWGI